MIWNIQQGETLKIAVPKEITEKERRVALIPDAAARLVQAGARVEVEQGAGVRSMISDEEYVESGATVVPDTSTLYDNADIVVKVLKPGPIGSAKSHEVDMIDDNAVLIALLDSLSDYGLVEKLSSTNITSCGMELVPRIARAQNMDVLSSMASIAGYKAVLLAANRLAKIFPMMITAAGTFPPAKGLVIGAGVAGLQAIATARRLGSVVSAFDVRPAVKEQVESLGASFVEGTSDAVGVEDSRGYAKEQSESDRMATLNLIHDHIKNVDFVISTAAIPGAPAPKLITTSMVEDMRSGSVIIDIAAETGGNCELTVPGEEVFEHGVSIFGPLNLPASLPIHSSRAFSRNVLNFLLHIIDEGQIRLDFEDDITNACVVTHQGKIVNNRVKQAIDARLNL